MCSGIALLIISRKNEIHKITPIFKAGKKGLLANYRPISVLPCLSKIIERITYNRLHSYFEQNKILYEKQFGFRAHHSTDHTLAEQVDSIFVDLSRAFYPENHDILIETLTLWRSRKLSKLV